MSAQAILVRGLGGVGRRLVRAADRLANRSSPPPPAGPTLAGDRTVEWAWCVAHLPESPGLVLDFGGADGHLSVTAAFHGHRVVTVDLEACRFPFELEGIEYRHGDINTLEFEPASFDCVINCSTIEHVGLGGRYEGSYHEADGDLKAMERMADLLKPGGSMVLTLPVGQDAVFSPFHRVYGRERLPRLLAPFDIVVERYMSKPRDDRWVEVDKATALAEAGSASYYALGLFTLVRR